MTYDRKLLFQLALIQFLVSQGTPCSFVETAGQMGLESLRSNSVNMTANVDGCKTLCNTTELCIAGEYCPNAKTCHMYSLETSLTPETDSVFFHWSCNTETDAGSTNVVPIVVGVVIGSLVVAGAVIAGVVLYKKSRKKRKTEIELQERTRDNVDVATEKHSLTEAKQHPNDN